MTDKEKEAIKILEEMPISTMSDLTYEEIFDALNLAIKSIKREVYWEDVKQSLNGWLNNQISPQTALNEIYRAYMGRGDDNE